MSEGKSRNIYIQIGVLLIGFIFIIRLLYIQVIDSSYVDFANESSKKIKSLFPDRGLVYDRNGKLIAYNDNYYNLMITYPFKLKNFDTLEFCNTIQITLQNFKERLLKAEKNINKGSAIFIKNLDPMRYAALQEVLFKYDKFYIEPKTDRKYKTLAGAHVLGYIGEVSQRFLDKQEDDYYNKGDFVGLTGLEGYYEKELRGVKGEEIILVNNMGKEQGHYANGRYDSKPISGKKINTTLDIELQEYAEKLMKNKMGSVVAIEPSTGEIITLVSSPNFPPEDLSIRNKSKHFGKLLKDPAIPLFNRAVTASYPPGSVFKLLNALIGLQEGVIYPETRYGCGGGFRLGRLRVGCHSHPGNLDLSNSVTFSCNSYYCNVYREILNDPKYNNTEKAYRNWSKYLNEFGLPDKLMVDVNGEKKGNVPSVEYYDKFHGKGKWNYARIISLSIGQGELLITPLQMANVICGIANRGYWYTPHCIKKIDEKNTIPKIYKEKHKINIRPEHFEVIIQGMSEVCTRGTAKGAFIPGIEICGKTGTAQNPHGKDHAVFMCFSPKVNPKIAIACIVENSGFGGTWAAPVCNLLIEKYLLKDSVSKKPLLEKRLFNANLLPKLKNPKQDSIDRAKADSIIKVRQKIKNDSINKKNSNKPDNKRSSNTLSFDQKPILRYGRKENT